MSGLQHMVSAAGIAGLEKYARFGHTSKECQT